MPNICKRDILFAYEQTYSFSKISKSARKLSFLVNTSVVVDEKNVPLGFVFGRDTFISFLEHIDDQFEKKVQSKKGI